MATSEYRQQKKAWNKGRRRAVRPFKGLAVLCLLLAVVGGAVLVVDGVFPTVLGLLLGQYGFSVQDEDATAVYYESSYATDEERVAAGAALSEEVEAEGATLLLNEDGALPLAAGARVTLFGVGSADLTYGGTGSGGLDLDEADTMKDALEAAGLEVNETMWEFYTEGAGSEGIDEDTYAGTIADEDTEYLVAEPALDAYSDTEWDSVAEYGDAAIVVLSRIGGEGADLPTEVSNAESGGYLGLSDNERALLQYLAELKAEGTIERIILVLNSSNTIQLDFLDDDSYDVDAILNIGGVGAEGVAAVAQILVGEVNPSGHLSDTYLADNLSSPAMANWGGAEYANAEEAGLSTADSTSYYVVYQEGIYIGYRYYETRYEDYVMGTGNAGDYSYSDDVAFAFGTGLSYTTFSWSDYTVVYDAVTDVYTVQVTVENTGDVAGKDVVQVYLQSPYTAYDQENGVEKAAVVLVGFAKTDTIEPGASQTVTVTVEGADLASYDAYGAGTYIMDAGTYYLTAAEDAHAAVNNVLAAKGYSPANTDGRMDAEGDASMVWSWEEAALDTTTYSVSTATGAAIENQFSDADINLSACTGDQTIVYLSRSDWEGTFPTEMVELYATDEMVEELSITRYDAETYDGTYAGSEMPTTGATNGLSLIDLYGLDYDDPLWDELLDQLTVDEMTYLLGDAFHLVHYVESIDMPGTRAENGPTGITMSLFAGSATGVDTMGLPSEDIMAATWNTELIYEVGEVIGEDCLACGITFLYGPAADIHRTPYGGRNFEYFSEDGYLSGKILAAEVQGIETMGAHAMVKHFVNDDQETNNIGCCVWENEQSLRELYLRAFQYAFTDAETLTGAMSSYTRIGCHWAGSDEGLIEGVLRGEWGAMGVVTSDNVSSTKKTYMNAVDAVLAGADIADSMMGISEGQLEDYADDPVVVAAMREAVHRVAYSVLNSFAMNGVGEESSISAGTPLYRAAAWTLAVGGLAGFAACTAVGVRRGRRYKRANPKPRKA